MYERSGELAERENFGPFDAERVTAERSPKRVRARTQDGWVLDTQQALLAWVEGPTPDYAIPIEDLQADLEHGPKEDHDRLGTVELIMLPREGHTSADGMIVRSPPSDLEPLEDHLLLEWDAVEAWYVEDERQRGHPRDPYHRIDAHETSHPVSVSVDGRSLAETDRALALFETGLPTRFYLPRVDVDLDALAPSSTSMRCAYKGRSTYYHADLGEDRVKDIAWTYPSPEPRHGRLQDRICFDQNQAQVTVAGSRLG